MPVRESAKRRLSERIMAEIEADAGARDQAQRLRVKRWTNAPIQAVVGLGSLVGAAAVNQTYRLETWKNWSWVNGTLYVGLLVVGLGLLLTAARSVNDRRIARKVVGRGVRKA